MKSIVVDLTFNKGIKIDGSLIQRSFCTNGKWIRFSGDNLIKIGGMLGSPLLRNDDVYLGMESVRSQISVIPIDDKTSYVFVTCKNYIGYTIINKSSGKVLQNFKSLVNNNLSADMTFQHEIITHGLNGNLPTKFLVIHGAETNKNISAVSKARLWKIPILPNTPPDNIEEIISPEFNSGADGGMCFFYPYLFLYGSNGSIKMSSFADPFYFDRKKDGESRFGQNFCVDTSKVLNALRVRGGANSPCLLLYTETSIIRFFNVAQGEADTTFKVDVVATDATLMSSRAVCSIDSYVISVGIDRFYIYNGTKEELVNPYFSEYFFNDVDLRYRQNVFAIKNPRFAEVWIFYTSKSSVDGKNDKAIIWNKRHETWYTANAVTDNENDTFNRDCGFVDQLNGIMYTFGRRYIDPLLIDDNYYLWKHEVGIAESIPDLSVIEYISSSFSSPYYSWASISKEWENYSTVKLESFYPNFLCNSPLQNKNNPLLTYNVSLEYVNYLVNNQTQVSTMTSIPIDEFTIKKLAEKNQNYNVININSFSRYFRFNISSNNYFEIGNFTISLAIGLPHA